MIAQKLFEQYQDVLDRNSFNEILIHIKKDDSIQDFINLLLNKDEMELFFEIILQLKSNKPLAYILNKKYFFENTFYVNENVLIPRIESELLVEQLLNYDLKNKTVIDICCGSGCLGISLKLKEPSIDLYLSDISNDALEVTKINLMKMQVEAQVHQADFLNVIFENKIVPDYIVINPPYIEHGDINLAKQTLNYEPHLALFAQDNGLYFYKILFNNLEKLFDLNPDLIIICEFGFEQKQILNSIFNDKGLKYNIEFKKDYSNNWRYFIIKNN
ncbi:peptide chain release factor N(5)-glutamine methyltransferase [Spiroplasma culicicola]|uniref:peptide chain release factor N(5)-glutamine methyltransferase n=1 Tax=Spiroplasma culicicola AES-1 TaxID=1276246 RepID=W6A8S6_9MOLU|nr:peptide chain release factor N(5)-glutamine methyltransferase [Spiroplasma culicicola]AHI53366.1 N5-glutamine S-adenosyl-L-methionine-dependent methyltransferase [Spiroplasma culicicola AES-1]